MMKASAGGGGKGMRLAWSETDVREGFESVKREGLNSFGDDQRCGSGRRPPPNPTSTPS